MAGAANANSDFQASSHPLAALIVKKLTNLQVLAYNDYLSLSIGDP